ncbi:hypothetical protein BGZ79_001946 [Entomortierella chlamydospora]|nr:hypothetical protein BGZ79_001946 [Entomortierella chlamydospora]
MEATFSQTKVELGQPHKHINDNSQSPAARISIDDIREALKDHYKSELSIRWISGDPLDLGSCYVNLANVEGPFQRQKNKDELKEQAANIYRMSSYENIPETNTLATFPLEEFFNRRNLRDGRNDVPKTILVQGRAGIGKTTLCKKLVHAYQQGLWNDRFNAVLWLPLRQLTAYGARNLEDILRHKYFAHYPELEKEKLVAALSARRDKVLFVLDGLDEIISNVRRENDAPLREFLRHLLRQQHVIITSRPSGTDTSILPDLDLELETVGFSTRNVKDYLANVLNPEAARAVEKFIQQTPLIQDLANIPIQLDVICYIWDSLPSDLSKITMTGLYQLMTGKLWRKDGVRLQKSEAGKELAMDQINKLRSYQLDRIMAIEGEYLGFLAFKGILSHQIEFEESVLIDVMEELDQLRQRTNQDFLPIQLIDELMQTSFLHTADADLDVTKDKSRCAWHFIHLTFQEYFAANWLARHFQTIQLTPTSSSTLSMTTAQTAEFVQQHKYDPRYEIVWQMVAGQLKGEALELFFGLLQGTPRDLIGGRHQRLLAECLKEARPQLNEIALKRLEAEMTEWLMFDMEMYHGDFKVHTNDGGRQRSLGSNSVFPQEIMVSIMNQSEEARKYVLVALRSHRYLAPPTIEALSSCLHDRDEEINELAADALGGQSTLPESSIKSLFSALKEESFFCMDSAAQLLGNQDYLPESTMLFLTDELLEGNWSTKIFSAEVIATISFRQVSLPESTILALAKILDDDGDDDDAVPIAKVFAAHTLNGLTTLSEKIVEKLNSSLRYGNQATRQIVIQVFHNVVVRSQVTLPQSIIMAFVNALGDNCDAVRNAAIEAIGVLPELPESAILALIGILQCGSPDAQVSAAQALGTQSILPEHAVRALVIGLEDKNDFVREASVRALYNESASREIIIGSQIAALKSNDSHARSSAASILGKVASSPKFKFPEFAVISLVDALQDGCDIVRASAAKALCSLTSLPKFAIETLVAALQGEGSNVRVFAAKALGVQLELRESTISALVTALQDEVLDVKKSVAVALSIQPKLPESAAPALASALENEDGDLRNSVVKALGAVGTLPESAISALVGILQNATDAQWTKVSAATVLSAQSELHDSTIMELTSAIQSDDNDVFIKSYVAEALGAHTILPEYTIHVLLGILQERNIFYMQIVKALGNQPSLTKIVIQILTCNLTDEREHDNEFCQQLIRSMPRKQAAVYRAKGKNILSYFTQQQIH